MSATAFLRGFLLDLLLIPVLLLALPWLGFLVIARGRGVGALGERFGGWRISRPERERIWVHCVSVGELAAAGPLLEQIARVRPGAELVLSVTTTTGREVARARYPEIPVQLFPLDLSLCVRRVLGRARPSMIVLLELEVWPQLILEASSRGIPVVVANGRISERGFRRLRRFSKLARPIFRRLAEVHACDEASAERFAKLGVPFDRIHPLGNLKFDLPPLADPAAVRQRYESRFGYPAGSRRWVAGCTHPGEEETILATHRVLRERWPEFSLLLAPRHTERSDAVASLVREQGFSVERYGEPEGDRPAVVVLDRTGELAELYAVGDVAFVGGSLIPRGGHNILEPVLAGVATVHGPHMSNFRDQVSLLTGGGACTEVGERGLTETVARSLGAPERRAERVEQGLGRIARSRGAAKRSADRLTALLDARRASDAVEAPAESPAPVDSTPGSR